MEADKVFIGCQCGSEGLVLQREKEEKSIYFAIFKYGNYNKMPWKYRFKTIWQIIRFGTPYGDQLCFGESEAKTMISYLNKSLHEFKKPAKK